MEEDSPYVRGEVSAQGVEVVAGNFSICQCCHRRVWCGGWNVCFECRMNGCESVHPELMPDGTDECNEENCAHG